MSSDCRHAAEARSNLERGLTWLFEQIEAKKRHVVVVVANPHVARHVIAEGLSEKLKAARLDHRCIASLGELRCDDTTVTFLMADASATKIGGCNIDAAWCNVSPSNINLDFIEMLKYRLLRSAGELLWTPPETN